MLFLIQIYFIGCLDDRGCPIKQNPLPHSVTSSGFFNGRGGNLALKKSALADLSQVKLL